VAIEVEICTEQGPWSVVRAKQLKQNKCHNAAEREGAMRAPVS